ncbi:UPF0052-domain-containing protein [Trichodelitschia bisporula]|uniref:UPF0052-domain-containing protein n=1 Tax=Trichodelitschia bisporula TaxID=703511 RepID=A0A6G1HSF5_9PEZI|nr:UPF0052-domain-containing protein [Trichodelitschia bisporula]
MTTPPSLQRPRGIVVFSGGSAANSLVDVFCNVAEEQQCTLSYVMPISDNGGSSSELIRVFGGPGIGDIRSRLVRLIPSSPDPEPTAIKALFNYRLPPHSASARSEWLDIVEARHALWTHISPEKLELIRSFLNLLNLEIVKRARPTSVFDFAGASIGNLFLTGARLFLGSLASAIYLFTSITRTPEGISVLPALNTNFTHHIAAGLVDDSPPIIGQNAISHPSAPTSLPSLADVDATEDANPPGSHPHLRRSALAFSKADQDALTARIQRVWYINPYGAEIRLSASPAVVSALGQARAVIYSIGSLYTSLAPTLILRHVGEALATGPARYKILLLNATIDRETGPPGDPMGAVEFVEAVVRAAAYSRGLETEVPRSEWAAYVTHVVYLDGEGAPVVDRAELAKWGVEAVRCYGRNEGGMLRFDGRGLEQVLTAIMGKGEGGSGRMARRFTLGQ